MKVCEYGIMLDANIFCNILRSRRVHVLYIAAIRNMTSECTLNGIVIRKLCFSHLPIFTSIPVYIGIVLHMQIFLH